MALTLYSLQQAPLPMQSSCSGCLTCNLRAKKLSFWATEASSWDREYSLLLLKPSLDSDPDDEEPYKSV